MKKYKNDFLLILIFAVLPVICFAGRQLAARAPGELVRVTVDGEEKMLLSLDKDGDYRVEHDGQFNVILVKDGSVSVTESNCPEKICQRRGKIRKNGESVICLPHKVVITIISNDERPADAVSE